MPYLVRCQLWIRVWISIRHPLCWALFKSYSIFSLLMHLTQMHVWGSAAQCWFTVMREFRMLDPCSIDGWSSHGSSCSLVAEQGQWHLSLSQFRSLLLVLVLALTVWSSPHGKVVRPRPRKDGGSEKLSEDCLNQKDPSFPTMVKVDIRIGSSDPASRMIHDIRNRSLAPWNYR